MAKARSPNYPSLSLEEAIKAVTAIHKADARTQMSREAVAVHMGYKGLSGPALSKLGALRAYGLLEGSADNLRLSNAAVVIIADDPSSLERQQEIRRAARRPKLFQTLYERFDNQRPSDANLRSYLIKDGFTANAADRATRIYLDTYELASREGGGYSSPEIQGEEAAMDHNIEREPAAAKLGIQGFQPAVGIGKEEALPPLGTRRGVFALAEGDVVVTVPEGLSSESVEDLEDYLGIFLRKVRRDAGLPARNADPDGNDE